MHHLWYWPLSAPECNGQCMCGAHRYRLRHRHGVGAGTVRFYPWRVPGVCKQQQWAVAACPKRILGGGGLLHRSNSTLMLLSSR